MELGWTLECIIIMISEESPPVGRVGLAPVCPGSSLGRDSQHPSVIHRIYVSHGDAAVDSARRTEVWSGSTGPGGTTRREERGPVKTVKVMIWKENLGVL